MVACCCKAGNAVFPIQFFFQRFKIDIAYVLKDLLIKMPKNSVLYRAGTKCGHLADTGRRILYRILTPFCFFYLGVITMTIITHIGHESTFGHN